MNNHTEVPRQGAGSNRERDPDYRAVIARLSDRWCVIRSKDGLQWIIQRKDNESGAARLARARWRSVSYCCTRAALLRLGRATRPAPDPAALAALAALPEWIGGAI